MGYVLNPTQIINVNAKCSPSFFNLIYFKSMGESMYGIYQVYLLTCKGTFNENYKLNTRPQLCINISELFC